MRKKPLLAIGMLALLPCRPAHAQDTLEYAVKFVCGRSSGGPGAPVAPGTYFTSINIHNPNRDSLIFQFKVAAPPFQFFRWFCEAIRPSASPAHESKRSSGAPP